MPEAPHAAGFCSARRELNLESLPVRGTLPDWLQGQLIRTTPGLYEAGGQALNHWFDGLAMLYRFSFAGGQVGYTNRFLRSRTYLQAQARGKLTHGQFATAPERNWLQRLIMLFHLESTDNASVNLDRLGGALVAYTETPWPIRFDPYTLETLGRYSYQLPFTPRLSTAHPHWDRQRGCHYNIFIEMGKVSRYHLAGIDGQSGQGKPVGSIATDLPAYIHSFGMTERYLIVTEFPLVVHPLRLRFSGAPFIHNFRWKPERGTRFHVIDKDTGQVVRTAQGAPTFVVHHVNAFEDGDDVVVDAVAYPDAGGLDQLYLDRLRTAGSETPLGLLTRFRIRPSGDLTAETLIPDPMDFPRYDHDRRAGGSYRYVFAVGQNGPDTFFDKLIKADLRQGSGVTWHEPGSYPGEPVFVPNPASEREDDGVVLSVVLNAARTQSFLLILDASSFEELARVEVPDVIPFGFHGGFFA